MKETTTTQRIISFSESPDQYFTRLLEKLEAKLELKNRSQTHKWAILALAVQQGIIDQKEFDLAKVVRL